MLIVLLGWLYVLAMVAITAPSLWLGAIIFLFGGIAPALLLLYVATSRTRRARREFTTRNSDVQQSQKIHTHDMNAPVDRVGAVRAEGATPAAPVTSATPCATPAPRDALSPDRVDTSRSAPDR